MLSNPAGDSIVTSWEKVVKYNPEVLVIAPCGFHIDRTIDEIHLLSERKEWEQLKAVQSQQVYIVDFDLFTQPSASTLVDGIELLSTLFHPDLFSVARHLEHKVSNLYQTKTYAHT
jgi:iron complex transport system substrate-binding protein